MVWDIEFGKILSLASEVPLDVRLEYQGCKWAIKTSRANAITKICDDRVHSSGSSSQNTAASLPKLDVRQTLAKFPLIDTDGNPAGSFMRVSAANAFCRLLQPNRTFRCVWPSIPEVEEASWNCSRGNGRHLDPTCFGSVSVDYLVLFLAKPLLDFDLQRL